MYDLIDSHCHLDFDRLSDGLPAYLHAARAQGIRQWVVPGTTRVAAAQQQQIRDQHGGVFLGYGLHPYFVEQHAEEDLLWLATQLSQDSAAVAIGECGLDGALEPRYWERQLRLLEGHLVLAQERALPLILHSRKTHAELYQHLRRFRLPRAGVIHAFSGSYEEAMRFIELGFCLGAGGSLTYERARKTRDTFRRIPLDSIVLETDAPDMPMQGFQGQINLPERLPRVLDVLAQLRDEAPVALARQFTHNTRQLFSLPAPV